MLCLEPHLGDISQLRVDRQLNRSVQLRLQKCQESDLAFTSSHVLLTGSKHYHPQKADGPDWTGEQHNTEYDVLYNPDHRASI